jgi:hypothetical protein
VSAKIIPFPIKDEVHLTEHERDAILLAADEMIAKGGKELLVQVLKGMKSDLVLGAQGEKLKHFGSLGELTLGEIEARIDRVLAEDLLRVEWYWNRPLIVHSPAGWERIRSLWAELLYQSFERRARGRELSGIYAEIGRVHREVKLAFLERVETERAGRFEPVLRAWREREGKRIRRRIDEVLDLLVEAGAS